MNTNLGILSLDNEWRITSASASAAAMLDGNNSSPAKIAGTMLSEYVPVSTGGGLPSLKAVEDALLSKGDIYVADFSSNIDGTVFIFCISRRLLKNNGDRDVEQLYRQNKKLTAIGIFSGGIAHDYNNALTAVLGNISLAKFEAENNRELLELLNDAEKASMRIKMLTERLTSYTRGVKPVREKVNITGLISTICEEKRRGFSGGLFFAGGIDIEAEGDAELLAMAVECVIQNAIEAIDPEAGRIDLDMSIQDVSQEEIFREMVLIPGRYIRLNVRDNGTGIIHDKISDIFNPYFTTKNGHDGIGLALAYSILKRHRGFISVDSEQNLGSTFSLYLPLF